MNANQLTEKEELYFDTIDKRVESAIRADGQKECFVSYSAYDANDEPIDNLDEIAVSGRVVLVKTWINLMPSRPYSGGKVYSGGKIFRSEVLENPTWLEVCVQANRAILCTEDWDHNFLEALTNERIEDHAEGPVTVYKLSMGS